MPSSRPNHIEYKKWRETKYLHDFTIFFPSRSVVKNPAKVIATPQKLYVQRAAPHNGKVAASKGVSNSAQAPANFFRTTAMGYDVLLNVFQCLTVKELLRASRVCRLFNYTASHPFLWRTIRMKNSPVNDWSGFARALRANGTRHLDMRKMLLGGRPDDQWEEFVQNISTVEQLQVREKQN